jgi:hypothetical protein
MHEERGWEVVDMGMDVMDENANGSEEEARGGRRKLLSHSVSGRRKLSLSGRGKLSLSDSGERTGRESRMLADSGEDSEKGDSDEEKEKLKGTSLQYPHTPKSRHLSDTATHTSQSHTSQSRHLSSQGISQGSTSSQYPDPSDIAFLKVPRDKIKTRIRVEFQGRPILLGNKITMPDSQLKTEQIIGEKLCHVVRN